MRTLGSCDRGGWGRSGKERVGRKGRREGGREGAGAPERGSKGEGERREREEGGMDCGRELSLPPSAAAARSGVLEEVGLGRRRLGGPGVLRRSNLQHARGVGLNQCVLQLLRLALPLQSRPPVRLPARR